MKRLIALTLAFAMLLSGCAPQAAPEASTTGTIEKTPREQYTPVDEPIPAFTGLDDAALLTYMEDAVYTELVHQLNDQGYFVENVDAVYISKEYLEEIAYNSQENIYFGYTLSELDACFQGTRYVFTLGDDGQTTVTEFQKYDNTYERILRNVTIGTGVILLCVTVSVVSGGLGAPAVSLIFAASAKSATVMALSSGVISGVSAGVATGIETGNLEEALKAAVLEGSEGFKWGAITGAVSGGVETTVKLKGATLNGLTMNQAAQIQMESGYPLDVIKQFSSMEQYEICQKAGLTPKMVNGNMALVRDIDLEFMDDMGRTNLQRMQEGLAPLDPNGIAYELHHIGQNADSTLALLTKAEHMQGGNNKIWHVFGESTKVHGAGNTWDSQRQQFYIQYAKLLTGSI